MTEKDNIETIKKHRKNMIALLFHKSTAGRQAMQGRIKNEIDAIDDWLKVHDNNGYIQYQHHFQERLNKVLYFIYK